jgi:hypothetical protein
MPSSVAEAVTFLNIILNEFVLQQQNLASNTVTNNDVTFVKSYFSDVFKKLFPVTCSTFAFQWKEMFREVSGSGN